METKGILVIKACQLDRPALEGFRRDPMEIVAVLGSMADEERTRILRRFFGFPSNLSRLDTLRPPGGNARPQGIDESYFARRQRRELPDYY